MIDNVYIFTFIIYNLIINNNIKIYNSGPSIR